LIPSSGTCAGDQGRQQKERQERLKVPEFSDQDLDVWWQKHDAWLNKEGQVRFEQQ
jgi:hypothetical protein